MVGKNTLTVRFIKATDYLKETKGYKHGDICTLLELKRWQYDQIRIGRRIPAQKEVDILIKKHTVLAQFFSDDDFVLENLEINKENSELVKSLKLVIQSQDQIIKLKDEKIKDLEKTIGSKDEAHEETLDKFYTEEEIDQEIIKRLKEFKNSNKK